MRNFLESEINLMKRENQKFAQRYKRELQEAHYKNRILEDAVAEDHCVIEKLRKQLMKFKMGGDNYLDARRWQLQNRI